ncbi:MAG: MTH938/NDUFAF3 family protein [Thermodesulfobacteriota bacterium]
MQIQKIAFGKLVLDGRTFTSDLVIFPDGEVLDGWRRQRGHRLSMEDISGLVKAGPDVIVAGTGAFGRLTPDPDLEERLLQSGILFLPARNKKAADLFNQRISAERVGACFHLTC